MAEFDVRFGTLNEYLGNEEYVEIPEKTEKIKGCECGFVSLHDPGLVIAVGECAFMGNQKLKGVTIPDRVKIIDRYAFFGCVNLLEIIIPDSVLSIGDGAFSCCSNLFDVKLGRGLETIGKRAFSGCEKLKKITIPESVEEICEGAFRCIPDIIICGKKGSTAEQYANKNGFMFEEIM